MKLLMSVRPFHPSKRSHWMEWDSADLSAAMNTTLGQLLETNESVRITKNDGSVIEYVRAEESK